VFNTISLYRKHSINWNCFPEFGFVLENMKLNMTADLAITGGPTHGFYSRSCTTTNASPKQYVAWWMLTFHFYTVYINTVKFYYRDPSKFISLVLILFFSLL
jgi:hypothetical protein